MATTFRVNLETVNRFTHLRPVSPTDDADNFRETRSTWTPNLLINNRALKHGDEFTVTSSSQIQYLIKTYTSGNNTGAGNEIAILEVV